MNWNMLKTVGAAVFTATIGMASMPANSGDGVVILQREVPPHYATSESSPGHAVVVDVSPDDKVVGALAGQDINQHTLELGDGDFASVVSGRSQIMGSLVDPANKTALSEAYLGANGANGLGGSSSPAQSMVPVMTGQVGPVVGAATGGIANSVIGATGIMNGLTGAILHSGGQ